MATFPSDIPSPHLNTSQDITYRVKSVQFGDGYEQIGRSGVNSKVVEYSVSWQGLTELEKNSLMSFFDEIAGAQAFNWIPPGESTSAQYKQVGTISLSKPGGRLWNLSTKFKLFYG